MIGPAITIELGRGEGYALADLPLITTKANAAYAAAHEPDGKGPASQGELIRVEYRKGAGVFAFYNAGLRQDGKPMAGIKVVGTNGQVVREFQSRLVGPKTPATRIRGDGKPVPVMV